ncbi:MAG TPA: type II toxin-antitoxin system VapC family toxin [Pyrinomonadaceae bacterium]|jgi:predicted nucleic acid-binding protein|nr:type II toxin-antitoxin system VapC family toxin [Pyrinomonadaceae bacterium]
MKTRKKTNIGFWDTSAIVPLCCQQNLSQSVRKLWRETARVVVWWGTTVEVRSAISRLHRDGVITAKGRQQALARLELLRQEWYEITPSEQARRLAEDLPDTYGLRALDSFQLAAALVWCREKPKNRTFVCDDARLAVAAEAVGFTVVP